MRMHLLHQRQINCLKIFRTIRHEESACATKPQLQGNISISSSSIIETGSSGYIYVDGKLATYISMDLSKNNKNPVESAKKYAVFARKSGKNKKLQVDGGYEMTNGK